MKPVYFITLWLILSGWLPAQAQRHQPDTVYALPITAKIKIDGVLDEPVWQQARPANTFFQRELTEGAPATERTEVAVLYDQTSLYIGVICYDGNPGKLVAQRMERDFSFDTEDNFEIVIDTYNDRRNGYLFVTNPNGAKFDAQLMDNGDRISVDWDGVWEVSSRVTDAGWVSEIEIPFSTLNYPSKPVQTWGINFERNIRHKREQDLWQGWSRDSELAQVSRAGTLAGLRGIRGANPFDLRPYASSGFLKNRGATEAFNWNSGVDVDYLITPTQKLGVTVNPDFAQVESDRTQINLTRFSLFYPEKRKFFLEGQNFFDFGLGYSIRPFYSRRIGLTDDGREVPILVGTRLLGKQGRSTMGGMFMQTARKDSIPSAGYGVMRWKQDLLRQSTIGFLGTGKSEAGRFNGTAGFDLLLSTSTFRGDKNLSSGIAYVESYTSDALSKTGSAHRVFLDYPNDRVSFSAIWDRSGKTFNPEIGFLRRTSYQMFNADFRVNPRPRFLPWIRRLSFKPFDVNYYVDDETGQLQSLWSEFRPLGFSTNSGEFFEFNVQRSAENLTEDFEIHENVTIPKGAYWFTHYELQFGTFQGRQFSGEVFVNWGDFYDGSRTEAAGSMAWKANKFFSLSADYQRNRISLREGCFTIHEVGSRARFAFNPDLYGSLYGQWNSDDNEIILNFRVHWIPNSGSDLYFVVNQTVGTGSGQWNITNTTAITKVIWRFAA